MLFEFSFIVLYLSVPYAILFANIRVVLEVCIIYLNIFNRVENEIGIKLIFAKRNHEGIDKHSLLFDKENI